MAYLLDTNVAIRLRDGDAAATARVAALVDAAADAYGAIVAQAGNSRRELPGRMIASQALAHRATLVTMNPDDFLRGHRRTDGRGVVIAHSGC